MGFKSARLLYASTLLLVAISGLAHAEVDESVRSARTMLLAGQNQQAFNLLVPMEATRAGDVDFDLTLGIAANETGQFTRAVFALERVLSVEPSNIRARAELGKALFALGDNAAARQVLNETKKENVPPEISSQIDEFLLAIDRNEDATRSSVKGYVEAGLGQDSNINSGPNSATVAVPVLGGLVFTLAPSNVKLKDDFYALGAGISGRYVIDPRLSLIAGAHGSFRFNNDYNDFDTQQLDVNAGAVYRVGKDEFTAVAQVGSFSANNRRLRDKRGIVGEWTHRPDVSRQWSSYVQLSTLRFPDLSLLDADRYVLGTTYAQTFNSGLLAYAGAYFGSENERQANVPHIGHRLVGLRAGLNKSINADVELFAHFRYEERHHGGVDPSFLVTRRDRQTNVNLGFAWVPAMNWRVTPQLSWLKNDSNIAISKFTKQVLSVTVRRDF